MKKIKLGDISNITYGKNLSKKKLLNEGYTVFGANGIIGFFNEYLYEDEMVLISCRGAYSGKINLSPKKSFITNNSLIVDLYIKDDCHKKLVYYFLQAVNKTHIVTGSAQPQVTINNVLPLEIPLPSLPTQRLIVQEIEKQFSRLDEGLDSLKRVKENLKKYKASVLKSAVEGKLTKDWRKSQADIESASKLLERILEEKKRKFLEENPKKKYKEPEGIKSEDIPEMELPEGWCFSKVEYITKKQEYGSSKKADISGDVPVLRMGNIQDGRLDFTNLKYFKKDNLDLEKLVLENRDLLFNRTNSAELVGKSAIYDINKHDYPCSFAGYLIRVQLFNDLFNENFLLYFLNGFYGKLWIKSVVVQQVGQANVNGTKLSNVVFPLPPLQEQNQIVKIVEEKLSVVEKLEKIVEENIKKAENLKQSILKKAFEGRLVEVSENEEEQVENLLEEITTEKARMEQEEKQAKRGMRKKKK